MLDAIFLFKFNFLIFALNTRNVMFTYSFVDQYLFLESQY